LESWPREVKAQMSASAVSTAPPIAVVHAPFAPSYIPVDVPELDHDAPARLRLGLQQRAASNLRSHVLRAARRFAVLVLADLVSFYVMRELVRTVRDRAWLGDAVAHRLQSTFPQGMLNGWQYAAALFVALFVTGSYGRGDQRRDSRRLFTACALATALPLWMTLWTRGLEPVVLQYAVTTLVVWAGLVAERRIIDRLVVRFLPMYRSAAPTLFVGPAEACREAIHSRAFTLGGDCRAVGFADVHMPPASDAIGHAGEFRKLLQRTGAEAVVVAGHLPDNRFREVVDASLEAEAQLFTVPRSIAIAGVEPNLVRRQGQTLIQLTTPSLKGWQFAVKRVIDVMGSLVGLVLASPVLLLIAAAVKVDSPGPVLFAQERVGLGGRRFRMLKFRTMRNGADREKHAVAHLNHSGDSRLFKIPNDPRVTRLGRWLRRWSVDELPQLWNVFAGDMSLIGPRPFFEADFARYQDHHFRRLGAKPGITGLWQVNGRSGIVDFEEVVRLDREYIENWSLWLDLRILALTSPAVIRRTGAY
jgi:exopolysaccharide biosynthesis polyprenyl glycosylphosphotransferase